jgi:hypothetical protein
MTVFSEDTAVWHYVIIRSYVFRKPDSHRREILYSILIEFGISRKLVGKLKCV